MAKLVAHYLAFVNSFGKNDYLDLINMALSFNFNLQDFVYKHLTLAMLSNFNVADSILYVNLYISLINLIKTN